MKKSVQLPLFQQHGPAARIATCHPKKRHQAKGLCETCYRRVWAQEHRDRAGHLRRKYGLTNADYESMLAKQGGGCALCGRKPKKNKLALDHDHTSGRVRGILCVPCNTALGTFKDSPEMLFKAIEYLKRGLS